MEPVRFADGFDGSDRVAFGLSAGSLGVVAGGLALGYLALRSPLPGPWDAITASLCVALAALMGWGHWAGRPVLAWGIAGCRYLGSPRRLTVRIDDEVVTERSPSAAPTPAEPARFEPGGRPDLGGTARRAPAPPPPSGPRRPLDEQPWARWLDERPPVTQPEPAEPEPSAEDPAAEVAGAPAPTPGPVLPSSWEHLNDEMVGWVREQVRDPSAPSSGMGKLAQPPAPTPLVVLPNPAPALRALPGKDGDEIDIDGAVPAIKPIGQPTASRRPGRVRRHLGGVGPLAGEFEPPLTGGLAATRRPRRGRAWRVTFFAQNGGVGRTTLATEVACLLASRGLRPDPQGAPAPLRVAFVDLDVGGSTACLRLGTRAETIDPAATHGGSPPARAEVHHSSGLLPVIAPASHLPWETEPAAAAALLHQLEADGVDLIIIDCNNHPRALSTWVLETADQICVVLSDSSRGVQDAYRSTAALRRLGFAHKLAYVVNQSTERVDFEPTMRDLGGRLLATIPQDPELGDAEDEHRIACLEAPGPGAMAIRRLASMLHPMLGDPERAEEPAAGSHPGNRPALGAR